jgi:uncharacterized membrane protein
VALEIVGLGAMIGMVAFALWVWPTLPESVPTHFGLGGRPDAWGRADSLGFLLALSLAFYVALSLVQRIPHLYNYPVPVTAENARRLYLLGRQLVLAMKVIVSGSFAALFCAIVMIARGQLTSLSVWFLPGVLLAVGAVLGIGTARMMRRAGIPD